MTKKKEEKKEIVIRNEKQLTAFRMRFKGHTYEQIAGETGYKAMTLEVYFARGGLWHEQYVAWKEWQIDQIKEQMNDMFVAQAVEANQQVVNISRGKVFITIPGAKKGEEIVTAITVKPDVILDAAQDILDRAGFKPAEKVDAKTPEDIAEKMMEFFESKEKDKIPAKKGKK